MKYILSILLLLSTILQGQPIEIPLCDLSLHKEIKVNTSATVTSWGVSPFTAYQIDDDVMYITFKDIGTYVITAEFSNGSCFIEDKYIIKIIECPNTYIYIPNAFTPDGDGVNEDFGAYGVNIKEYHMEIFNRWGELLFDSFTLTTRWNGYYNQQICENDIYVYKIAYKDNTGKQQIKIGKTTLIK